MSYSNPRWYGVGDPAAFTKGFQSAFNSNFKNATDYFAAKEQELVDYNTNLENRADNLRNQLLTGKDVTPEIQKQVETQVQDFLKEGKTFDQEGKTFVGRALTTRVNMKTKAELDKAQMNFMASSNVMNEFLSNALSGELNPPEDLDRGSATYLDYVTMIETIKKDPSKLNFKYKGKNDFDFSLEYKDPRTGENKTLNSTEVAAVIEDNNPAVKKAIVDEKNTFVAELIGSVKTRINELKAKRFKSGPGATGKEVLGPEVVKEIIEQQMRVLSAEKGAPSDINRYDLVNDVFNNFVSLSDSKRVQVLKNYNGDNSVLANAADKLADSKEVDNSGPEALSDLLDIERGDIKSRNKAYEKLGITGQEQITKANEELENYRKGAVEEYLINQVEASGIPSEFLQAYRPTQRSSTRRGPGAGGVPIEQDPYVIEQTNKAFNVIASSAAPSGKVADVLKPNTRIVFGNTTKTLSSVKEDENTGKVKLIFVGPTVTQDERDKKGKPTGRKERVPSVEETYEFNPWSIEESKLLYLTTSSSAGKTGPYIRGFETEGFRINMARRFASPQGMKTLEDPRAGEWFQFAESYNTQGLINHAAANPYLYSDAAFRTGMRPSVAHWQDFYRRNKGAIDLATLRNR